MATIFLLYWRFQVALVRYLDQDEFLHLYHAYMESQGKIPYQDFGYFFSPIFISLFSPIFRLFPESAGVIFIARSLNFFIFLVALYAIWLVGKTLSGSKVGILAVYLFAFLPLAFDKTIEVRPDMLAIIFYLLSFLFLLYAARNSKKPERLTFIAGIFYGLSILVLFKTIFAYPGLLIYLFLNTKNFSKKLFQNLFLFHLGMAIPWAIMILVFIYLGILDKAFYCIYLFPMKITAGYTNEYFVPFFPFKPSDSFYGVAGKSLPWILSNLTILLGILGLVKSRWRIFLMVSFVCFALPIFFLYKITNVQYYLPALLILTLGAAELLGYFFRLILKKSKTLLISFWLLFLAIFNLAFWQSAREHRRWRNDRQLAEVEKILAISNPQDHFFDQTGTHLFRPTGYYFCCAFFDIWPKDLPKFYSSLEEDFKAKQTKFIFQGEKFGRLSAEEKKFLEENYFPSGVEKILVAGKKVEISPNTSFELVASGYYNLSIGGAKSVFIDEQPFSSRAIYLNNGVHVARGGVGTSIFLLYDIEKNLKRP